MEGMTEMISHVILRAGDSGFLDSGWLLGRGLRWKLDAQAARNVWEGFWGEGRKSRKKKVQAAEALGCGEPQLLRRLTCSMGFWQETAGRLGW